MKRLKQKQLGYFCQYCPPKTNRAKYRADFGFNFFACEEHKNLLPPVEVDEEDFYMKSSFYLK